MAKITPKVHNSLWLVHVVQELCNSLHVRRSMNIPGHFFVSKVFKKI